MCRLHRLTVAAAVFALAAAAAAPAPVDVPRMDLSDVIGRTVCPLKVVVDDDPLRLPRRIKFLTCDREPSARRRCPAATVDAPHACCHPRRHYHDYSTQCVEVFDSVVVQYVAGAGGRARNATQLVLQVPVGCACVALAGTAASEDD